VQFLQALVDGGDKVKASMLFLDAAASHRANHGGRAKLLRTRPGRQEGSNKSKWRLTRALLLIGLFQFAAVVQALQPPTASSSTSTTAAVCLSRRASIAMAFLVPMASVAAVPDEPQDRFDVDSYIRTGVVMNPMGVSGQAGKSRPETGV
jgi:hypothetical protein